MIRIRTTRLLDGNGRLIGYSRPRRISGNIRLRVNQEIFVSLVDSPYLILVKQPDNTWEVELDTARRTRERDFVRSEQKARSDAITTTALSREQKKILYGVELTDTEKEKVNTDFP